MSLALPVGNFYGTQAARQIGTVDLYSVRERLPVPFASQANQPVVVVHASVFQVLCLPAIRLVSAADPTPEWCHQACRQRQPVRQASGQ